MDMRSVLVQEAKSIVASHKNTGVALSSLIAKTASARQYNDNLVNALVSLTNKEHLLQSPTITDFNVAVIEDVYKELRPYAQKTANYTYPEYNQQPTTRKAASGSDIESLISTIQGSPINHAEYLAKKANEVKREYKVKRATLFGEVESKFSTLQDKIRDLKIVGVGESTLIGHLRDEGAGEEEISRAAQLYQSLPVLKSASTYSFNTESPEMYRGMASLFKELNKDLSDLSKIDGDLVKLNKAHEGLYSLQRVVV